MQQQMQQLVDLQRADIAIGEIQTRQGACRKELDALEAESRRIEEMMTALEAQIAEREEQVKECRHNLELEKENATRSEARLPAIKTQKEYVAVLKEIDTAKRLARELEERIGTVGQEVEALRADRDEKSAALAEIRRQAEEKLAEVSAELESLEADLARTRKEREQLFGAIPVPLQKRYNLLRERRGGVAVVEANQGACLGCNMHLPPQLYNSLFRLSDIQSCPHCSRLLFIADKF